ncbi:MAG: hypothetical protein M1281_06620 [Chloroflexi bacterium]|nr:hypothetical protein [Chloroflexota bacterium]
MNAANDSADTYPVKPEADPFWKFPFKAAVCSNCGASYILAEQAKQQLCPMCCKAALEPQSNPPDIPVPELQMPFTLDNSAASRSLAGWTRGVWLHPPEFDPALLSRRLSPLYLPQWLVDGKITGAWDTQVGFNYQVMSSHEAYDAGRWTSQQTPETHVRWEPRAGQIERLYKNLSVPGLEEFPRMAAGLGGFPIQNARPYDPAQVLPAVVRLPNIPTSKAWTLAEPRFIQEAAHECQGAAGGQHIEQFNLQATYRGLNWTLLLVPVFSTYYRDDAGTVYPIFVNAQTGEVFGVKRASQKSGWTWTAVLASSALLVFVLGFLLTLAAGLFVPAGLIGGLMFVLAVVLALASPVPAVWAWQFNRSRSGDQ